MGQILKSLWFKRVVWLFIIVANVWFMGFELPLVGHVPGPNSNMRYPSPNCAYYVIYRQSLWEKFKEPYSWSSYTVYLYDKAGKLLHKGKTSLGNGLNPRWLPNTVSQGDAKNWWRYRLPTTPGNFLHPENCLAQEK
ncbi:hypothetical protein FHW67_000720 [Herbaspirillum sp. Sphag1AN]|nr:hypothetical protein [Herbaspirillum sp. Sphag1AN]MBB3245262.1 hypothetical protein [Herbaspirillum sp. Sphag64]